MFLNFSFLTSGTSKIQFGFSFSTICRLWSLLTKFRWRWKHNSSLFHRNQKIFLLYLKSSELPQVSRQN